MSSGLGALGNVVGLIIGLGIVAVIATHPTVISSFFNGVAAATTAAERG